MKQKLLESTHSMKLMWVCVALVLLVAILAIITNAYVPLFVLPCMVMVGAMLWMMMGSGTHRGEAK